MKNALRILGILLILFGLIWAAQGSGLFPYPQESFMVGASRWIYYGLATAVAGMGLWIFARNS